MSFDPDDISRSGSELGHVFEDLKRALLTWSGSIVASPGGGAGRVRVDDKGLPSVTASCEPKKGSEDGCHLGVESSLPGP